MASEQHLTENIKLRIDLPLKERLQQLADKGDRTVAQEMRRALRKHVQDAENGATA